MVVVIMPVAPGCRPLEGAHWQTTKQSRSVSVCIPEHVVQLLLFSPIRSLTCRPAAPWSVFCSSRKSRQQKLRCIALATMPSRSDVSRDVIDVIAGLTLDPIGQQ